MPSARRSRRSPPAGGPTLKKHTAEFQVACNDSTAKWAHLTKHKQLPRTSKVGVAHLWLAVLEPSSRAHRLLHALGADPDQLREAVLEVMTAPGSPPPTWPNHVRPSLFDRLASRFFERVNIAS